MKFFLRLLLVVKLMSICYTQSFNYYSRNEITGSFVLMNIDGVPDEYKITYELKDNKVTGYYYDSSNVKFIDEVKDNRVQRTVYYDKKSASAIFEKNFYYNDNGDIKCVEFCLTDSKNQNKYEAKYFFRWEGLELVYNAYCSAHKGSVVQHAVSEGFFSAGYEPLEIHSECIYIEQKHNTSLFSSLDESFSYDAKGLHTYKLFVNGSLKETKEISFKDDAKLMNEFHYDSEGTVEVSKRYTWKDSILTQEFFTGREVSKVEFKYQQISDNCFILKFVDWNDEPCTKIETMDEVIYVKNSNFPHVKRGLSHKE